MADRECINSQNNELLINIKPDSYNCINLDTEKVKFNSEEDFEHKLTYAVSHWKQIGINCVLIKVHIQHSMLIPLCVKNGFVFHHAQPEYVFMQQWLSTDKPNMFPAYAHNYVGAGGFVVNEKNQILVIKEKLGPAGLPKFWKLPGGYVNKGEDLGQAAVREVFEETGVQCEFKALIAFRHQHKFKFKCSDMYCVCLMKPKTEEIKACQHEVAECKWMDLEEYIKHKEVSTLNRYFAERYLDSLKNGNKLIECEPVKSLFKTNHLVYSTK